jgi:putative flippase GtrA
VSERQPTRATRTRAAAEALRFARSLVVGSGGSALDFAAVAFATRVLDFAPVWGRVFGLVVSGVALFLGSRSYAFRATSESAAPQVKRFVIAELIGFPLNVLVFQLLAGLLPQVAPEVLTLAANFALFVTYYYPVRNYVVFRTKPSLVVQAATAGS